MRLSGFHIEIAKLIAKGLPNREIKKAIQISDSRLSVLRANPLMRREVEKYVKLEEDKYKKALDVFAQEAEDCAKEMVKLGKNPMTPAPTRFVALKEALENASKTSNAKINKSDDEIVFEKLLRVTKRTSGQDVEESVDNVGDELAEHSMQELLEDLQPAENDDEIIDIQAEQPTFTKQVHDALQKQPMPTTGDNGGKKKFTINPRLKEMLRH